MNESEHLTPINNHISQPVLGADELPDDHTHQTKTDVDLHDGKKVRDVCGQHDLEKHMGGVAVERTDELDFIRRGFHEAGIEVQDGAEDCHRHAGQHDGLVVGAEPDDEQRCESRLRQAV